MAKLGAPLVGLFLVVHISERIAEAGVRVTSLLKTEGESSAELDGSSLPPLVVEGYFFHVFQVLHSDQQI